MIDQPQKKKRSEPWESDAIREGEPTRSIERDGVQKEQGGGSWSPSRLSWAVYVDSGSGVIGSSETGSGFGPIKRDLSAAYHLIVLPTFDGGTKSTPWVKVEQFISLRKSPSRPPCEIRGDKPKWSAWPDNFELEALHTCLLYSM